MMILDMTLQDLDAVVAIERELFTSSWTKEQFEYEINENPFSKLYVLKKDAEIIGYGGFWALFERAEITVLAIKEEYQGQGLGEKMLSHLIDEAIKKACDIVLLEVRVSNDRAIALYRKCGFEQLRIRKDYYQDNHEDAIEMMKVVGGLNEKNISD